MKTKFKILFFFIIISLVSGCRKSSDCYSCDVKIDSFIKENEKELKSIDVKKMASYDRPLQRAIFRMYDTSRKQQMWVEKFQFILDNNINNYSKDELAFVREILEYISRDGIEQIKNDQIKSWIIKSRRDFFWNDERIRFIFMSLDVDEEVYLKSISTSLNTLKVSCNCSTTSDGMIISDCSSAASECSDQNLQCTPTQDSGCGPLWLHKCDGDCKVEGTERTNQN
ncbi:bacteriocin fulvocin C-related protein [Sphingobacterium sp.]|uniref:bacteriocin fulvocin C-related protein n=1 Tax=Sphingobacterium sp. TaxID=341027 RepID=UPI0028A28237|nr:bacteriocin fulvocin C-related protein [Sphingobacterium sp.]